jgi:thymidylate synthase
MDEQGYLDLLSNVLYNGDQRIDRTGTGTLSLFAPNSLKFNLSKFPLLTTKKVPFKMIMEELLWFLRGDTDAKILAKKGVNIWNDNSSRSFLDSRKLFHYPEGVLGPLYGFQFRHFGAVYDPCAADTSTIIDDSKDSLKNGFDQIKYIEDTLKKDPFSRRIVMSSWNANDLDKMALLPCHGTTIQFYVDKDMGLSCHMYQRSVDLFLGLPFNIASYALLVHIFAKKCGLVPRELTISFGDAHIYSNHVTQVKEQLTRTKFPLPSIVVKDSVIENDYSKLDLNDFELINYKSHGVLKGKMAI